MKTGRIFLISLTIVGVAALCVTLYIKLYGGIKGGAGIPPLRQALVGTAKQAQAIEGIFTKKGLMKKLVPGGLPKKESFPLRLTGIYEHGKEKVACIENLITSKTGQYRTGDSVMGATVIQILSSKAILLKDGRKTILTMNASYDWPTPDGWIDVLSEDSFVVSKNRLNRKVPDVNQLLSEVITAPNIRDGKIDGFRICALKPDGIVSRAGFNKGDIIKSVNGEKLNTLKEPLKTYEALRQLVNTEKEPRIKVKFERDNKIHTFTYRILEE